MLIYLTKLTSKYLLLRISVLNSVRIMKKIIKEPVSFNARLVAKKSVGRRRSNTQFSPILSVSQGKFPVSPGNIPRLSQMYNI